MDIKHIGIITGGKRSQARVNIHHAESIAETLQKHYSVTLYDLSEPQDIDRLIANQRAGKLDFVVNNAAGKEGGDGTVEGFLTILGIPFLGSGMLATAIAFDKRLTKELVSEVGIPVIDGTTVMFEDFRQDREAMITRIEKTVGYPLVVKACRGSDQIGSSLVKALAELIPALERGFKEDEELVVEKFIERAAEVTCMVIGHGKKSEALQPAEFLFDSEFPSETEVFTMAISRCSPETLEKVRTFSRQVHMAVGCSDYSRSDFIVDKKGDIHFLEINAHAGLWNGSMTNFVTRLTKGWEYEEMLHELISLAQQRLSNAE